MNADQITPLLPVPIVPAKPRDSLTEELATEEMVVEVKSTIHLPALMMVTVLTIVVSAIVYVITNHTQNKW